MECDGERNGFIGACKSMEDEGYSKLCKDGEQCFKFLCERKNHWRRCMSINDEPDFTKYLYGESKRSSELKFGVEMCAPVCLTLEMLIQGPPYILARPIQKGKLPLIIS